MRLFKLREECKCHLVELQRFNYINCDCVHNLMRKTCWNFSWTELNRLHLFCVLEFRWSLTESFARGHTASALTMALRSRTWSKQSGSGSVTQWLRVTAARFSRLMERLRKSRVLIQLIVSTVENDSQPVSWQIPRLKLLLIVSL